MTDFKRCNLKTVSEIAGKREAFKCNNTLTGEWYDYRPFEGMLSGEDFDNFRELFDGSDVFVIKSYATPIAAWHPAFGWWICDEGHTQTTKRHISSLRTYNW